MNDPSATTMPESSSRQVWNRFRAHKVGLLGLATLVLLSISFFLIPLIMPYEFDELDSSALASGPSFSHPFGTDEIGRDLLVRAMVGGQYSLRIAIMTAVLSTTIGALVGAIAGYYGALVDAAVSYVVNVLMTIPLILILIVFGSRYGSQPNIIPFVIAAISWLRASRLVRAEVIQLKEREFVQAARAAGASTKRIIFNHLLPNLIGVLLVEVTLLAGTAIILESTLSFLGLGVQPPNATLGTLIADSKGALQSSPSRVLIPGAVVTLIILSINFIGDALRDSFDTKSGDY